MSLQTFPQELLLVVLEQVCHLIVRDLTTLDLTRKSCGRFLHQFFGLHLVSRSFHGLLTRYIRVDGNPIRKRILELQMQKLINFLQWYPIVGRSEFRVPVPLKVSDIYEACGHVWKNPLVFSIVPDLFEEDMFLSQDAAKQFLCWAPESCKEWLTETKEIDSEDIQSEEHLNEYEYKNSNIEDEATAILANLAYGKTYKLNTQNPWTAPGIEFEVGRHKFPFTIHYHDSTRRIRGYWIGTSISSYTFTTNAFNVRNWLSYPVRKNVVCEKEGRYWLWFLPGCRYILVDYGDLKVVDSQESTKIIDIGNFSKWLFF